MTSGRQETDRAAGPSPDLGPDLAPDLAPDPIDPIHPTNAAADLAMPRSNWLYRRLLDACRLLAWCLRIRLVLEGAENLPRTSDGRLAGGWIAAGFPHRTWIEPFVVALLLPREPRLVFFGEAAPMRRSALRRWMFRRVGGIVPIPESRSVSAFERHVDAAVAALRGGYVFALFPEVGPPSQIGQARPFGGGIGYFAIRSGAPIVPLVIGGSEEVHVGRRLLLRALPPLTARELAGIAAGERLPEPGSAAERDLARRITAGLHELTAAAVAGVQARAATLQPRRKRWRWLTGAFH